MDAQAHRTHHTPGPFHTRYARRTLWIAAILGGVVLALWLAGTPPGVLGKADSVGYAICHRIAERTFHTHDGRELPLCARCTGIYLGVLTGLGMFATRGRLRGARLPNVRVLLLVLLLGAGYAIDGLNSYLSIFEAYQPPYQPHNTLRLLTGLSFGLGMITIVLPVFNTVVWYAPPARQPVASLRELALLYVTAAAVGALVLLSDAYNLDALLKVLGVLSAAGVVLMFAIIGTVLFLTVTRRENMLVGWRDLLLPALVGVTFALAVIGAIDLVRYIFTGTWDGFALPGVVV